MVSVVYRCTRRQRKRNCRPAFLEIEWEFYPTTTSLNLFRRSSTMQSTWPRLPPHRSRRSFPFSPSDTALHQRLSSRSSVLSGPHDPASYQHLSRTCPVPCSHLSLSPPSTTTCPVGPLCLWFLRRQSSASQEDSRVAGARHSEVLMPSSYSCSNDICSYHWFND